MGSLVSRRRKRSEVRNVSTQATECIPGRVLHGVTDSLEDQKLQSAVAEVTIGDGLATSPVLRYARARQASLNKKRTGFSRVLGGVMTKVDKKQVQQQLQPTSRADFSAQYDFLALPGQVSPTYRRRSEDATAVAAAASAGRKASTAPRRSPNDAPDAPAAARSLATTKDGRTENVKKVGNKDADHSKPPKVSARSRIGEKSAIRDKEMIVAMERRKGTRATSLDDLRVPLRPKAQDKTGQKTSGAGSGARGVDRKASLEVSRGGDRKASLEVSRGGDRKASLEVSRGGDKKASLEVSTAAVKARGGDRKASLEVSRGGDRKASLEVSRGGDIKGSLEVLTGAGKAGPKSTGIEVDERNTERDRATRAAAAVWESEEQTADENCNILKEGTLLQDLRNADIYGACPDNDDVSAVAPVTREKTNAQPLVNENNCLLHEEKIDVKQISAIDSADKGFTKALQEKRQTAARSLVPAENAVDEASFGQVDKSNLQHQISGELPQTEVQPQKQPEVEAHNETEVQIEAEEDEDMAEDTLDWNADDRTRSPSDSRPNSVSSSYASDEDCTIDAIETTVNQPQTTLTILQESSTHSFADPLSITAAQVISVPDVRGFHLSSRREETDATDQYQGLVTNLLPVTWLEKAQSVTEAADDLNKVPRAPLVVPEETDIYFSAASTDYPASSSSCSRQQRDVCIQKSCHDHADICLITEFICPRDPAKFKGASTTDTAQQTLLTQPNEIDTLASVPEPTNGKVGETGFSLPEAEDMANKMRKVETKLTSSGTPQKSLLAKQETQAMTLLILTGTLPGETESEGAMGGAGDAQNLDATSGVEEGQEISEMEGIAAMLHTQSKSSCKLEQLQVEDCYESLSRLIDLGLSCPDGEDASDEEAHSTIFMADEDIHDILGLPYTQQIQFRNCSKHKGMPSVIAVSMQELEELSIENGKVEQASDSTGEEGQEAGTLSLTHLSAAALEEIQPESILSLSECGSNSTELTVGSVADILEKSSSFPCLEPSLGVVSSTSEEDWDIIPLRRVPAHTNLNSAKASASSLPAGEEIVEIQSTDAEYIPEYQNDSKDVKDEVLEAIPISMQPEPPHAAQPYISYAEGDSNPAQDSPMYPTLEEKINYTAEVPPGDLLPPKSAATDADLLQMEDAPQNANANNSQAMTSLGKKKKKKKGGRGKQK